MMHSWYPEWSGCPWAALSVHRSLGEEMVSERRIGRVLCQSRTTQRYAPVRRDDEAELVALDPKHLHTAVSSLTYGDSTKE